MKKPLLFASVLVLAAPHALAGGLNKRLVAADAQWVAHFDIDALKATRLFAGLSHVQDEHGNDPWESDDFKELERELGVNPLEIAHSVTMYGTSEDPEEGTIILHASADFDRVIERLQREDGYRSIARDGVELHGWSEDGQLEAAFYVHANQDGSRTVVFSEDGELIARGIDIVRGSRPNLTQVDRPRLAANPTIGAFVYIEAAMSLGDLAGGDQLSSVAELAQGFVLEVGESRSRLHVSLTVDAENGEDAQNISQIAAGARALAALAADELPPVALELLNSVRVQARGTQVLMEFDFDSDRLMRELDGLQDD